MLHHRAERFPTRTLSEFVGRGLFPCYGCLQEALGHDVPSLFACRVYHRRASYPFPLGTRACKSCGFVVFSNGTFEVSSDLMREMCRRETEEDGRRSDVKTDAGPCVSTNGGLIMRHGDSKTEFRTGAQRDTDKGKGNPSLISPVLIHRLGVLLHKGAEHYGPDNWMKGMPYRRTADSIIRHIFQWLAGDTEEDHLAAVCFGAMCLMTYESDKVLDQKLDDRDEGLKKILASILTLSSKDTTLKTDEMKICSGCSIVSTSNESGVCSSCTLKEKESLLNVDRVTLCIKCGIMNTVQSSGICYDCQEKGKTSVWD